MNFKKIIFLMLFFIFAFAVSVNADSEEVDFNFNSVAKNFNTNKYVADLAALGIDISATQSENQIILTYNNADTLVYSFDESKKILSAEYSNLNNNSNILNAIFIDTISNMQGNTVGELIPFALGDSFCYSTLTSDGIFKEYISNSSGTALFSSFKINPFKRLSVPSTSAPIQENSFLLEYENFYSEEDCVVKQENLIFYKTFSEDGNMELYIGQGNELVDEQAYESILTALNILLDNPQVSSYFKKNYPSFSTGNFEFDGVSVSLDVTELPVSNIDTVLVPSNMEYAKFSINRDVVKQNLTSLTEESTPQKGDSTNMNDQKRFAAPLVFSLVIIGLVFLIIVVGSILRKRQDFNDL